jgi:creatinine amidohydrolase/Fe(II)-dependent formamide hydrolase-like protein
MTQEIFLRNLTSPQVGDAASRNTILLLPLGQTEQHGEHLAIGADSIIAENVAVATATELQGQIPVLVAPPIQYGYSNDIITSWPGTFVVGAQVMIDLITDVCCSAVKMGFKKIVIVSGHGHHVGICRVAIRQVFDNVGVNVVFTQPHAFANPTIKKVGKGGPGANCHAGEYETSLLMHFGYTVDLSKTSPIDSLRFKSEYVSAGVGGAKSDMVFWSTWGLQKSKTGTYGDPSVASEETGNALMKGIVNEFCQFLEEYHKWEGPLEPGDE